jgi:hypothetical protein
MGRAVIRPTPFERYYTANEGRWRGPVRFRLTSPGALWRADLTVMQRLSWLSLALLRCVPGPVTMHTTVSPVSWVLDRAEVTHTTRITVLGMTIMRSVEVFAADAGGRGGDVTGAKRLWPFVGAGEPYVDSRFEVTPDGRSADYRLSMLGTWLEQRGEIGERETRITQSTAFATGEQRLVRVAARRG